MSLIIGAFVLAVGVVTSRLVWLHIAKTKRAARFAGLELRPNCLLTRHPIVFLTTPASLFRLFNTWSDIPLFLSEHGYKVFEIEIPKSLHPARFAIQALDAVHEKCHVIATPEQEDILKAIAKHKHPMAASLTLVYDRAYNKETSLASNDGPSRLSANDLKPLDVAIERFESKQLPNILDLAISLAERDVMMSD